MKRTLHLWALLCCAACPTPPKPPVPPTPTPGPATCADVCRREAELGCEAAKPTAQGTVCVEVCKNVVESSVVHWDLDCRARALTCLEIDRCEEHP